MDQPTTDPSSFPAGPSSPPPRRRRRQEDLVDPQGTDSYAQFNPPRPPRNPARNASYDPLDGETGTFLSGHDDDDEDIDDTAHGDAIGSYGRLDQEEYTGPTDFAFHSRSYDDEDAALQAALKASMEDLPPDWEAPVLEPKEKPIEKRAPAPVAAPEPVPEPPAPAQAELAGGSRFKEELDDEDEEPTEQLSPGESISLSQREALT